GGSAAGDEGALEVHADDLVELLIAHAHQQVVAGDAGVVDEDVEPAVLGGDLFDRRAEGGAVADIDGRDTRGSSCGLDGGLEVVERGFGAADEHHVAAIRGETLGDAAADAAAGSGDDGDAGVGHGGAENRAQSIETGAITDRGEAWGSSAVPERSASGGE